MERFLVIKRSNKFRKLLAFIILLPFWLMMLWLVYYSKIHPESKTFLSFSLFILALLILVILSDNIHKIIAKKYLLNFDISNLKINNKDMQEISFSSILKINVFVNDFDNKLWLKVELRNSQTVEFQIIDNWFKTPFLTTNTKINFKRLKKCMDGNAPLKSIVDSDSIIETEKQLRIL